MGKLRTCLEVFGWQEYGCATQAGVSGAHVGEMLRSVVCRWALSMVVCMYLTVPHWACTLVLFLHVCTFNKGSGYWSNSQLSKNNIKSTPNPNLI